MNILSSCNYTILFIWLFIRTSETRIEPFICIKLTGPILRSIVGDFREDVHVIAFRGLDHRSTRGHNVDTSTSAAKLAKIVRIAQKRRKARRVSPFRRWKKGRRTIVDYERGLVNVQLLALHREYASSLAHSDEATFVCTNMLEIRTGKKSPKST